MTRRPSISSTALLSILAAGSMACGGPADLEPSATQADEVRVGSASTRAGVLQLVVADDVNSRFAVHYCNATVLSPRVVVTDRRCRSSAPGRPRYLYAGDTRAGGARFSQGGRVPLPASPCSEASASAGWRCEGKVLSGVTIRDFLAAKKRTCTNEVEARYRHLSQAAQEGRDAELAACGAAAREALFADPEIGWDRAVPLPTFEDVRAEWLNLDFIVLDRPLPASEVPSLDYDYDPAVSDADVAPLLARELRGIAPTSGVLVAGWGWATYPSLPTTQQERWADVLATPTQRLLFDDDAIFCELAADPGLQVRGDTRICRGEPGNGQSYAGIVATYEACKRIALCPAGLSDAECDARIASSPLPGETLHTPPPFGVDTVARCAELPAWCGGLTSGPLAGKSAAEVRGNSQLAAQCASTANDAIHSRTSRVSPPLGSFVVTGAPGTHGDHGMPAFSPEGRVVGVMGRFWGSDDGWRAPVAARTGTFSEVRPSAALFFSLKGHKALFQWAVRAGDRM